MVEGVQVCRWLECDKPALVNGGLCETHLARAFSKGPKVGPTATDLAINIGAGIVSAALFEAIKLAVAWSDIQFCHAEMEPEARTALEASLSDKEGQCLDAIRLPSDLPEMLAFAEKLTPEKHAEVYARFRSQILWLLQRTTA